MSDILQVARSAVEQDLAAGRLGQSNQQLASGRLSAAGLPNQPESLARHEFE